MPSGLRKTTGNHFEIYYEQPWGGVASDKDAVDIGDNEFQFMQGVVEIDGVLCYLDWIANPNFYTFPTYTFNTVPQGGNGGEGNNVLMFSMASVIYALDIVGNIYALEANVFVQIASPPDAPWVFVSSTPPHPSTCEFPTDVKVINGVAYIANFYRGMIYTWDGTTYAIGTSYTGGLTLGILNDYLLALGTFNSTDGVQLNRINWSGPGEFTTWDPSVSRVAGFNTLASVDDRLTGFLSFASVGFALSAKGLTQLNPTGVGIGPFAFTALWTSEVGQGVVYDNTVVQYGPMGFCLTDSGVFVITSGGAMTDISGAARTAILKSYQPNASEGNNIFNVSAAILLYNTNANYPTPFYVLFGLTSAGMIDIWMLNLKSKAWSFFEYNPNDLLKAQYPVLSGGGEVTTINIETMDYGLTSAGDLPSNFLFQFTQNPLTLASIGMHAFGVTTQDQFVTVCLAPNIYSKNANLGIFTDFNGGVLNLTFKAEEIKLGFTRKPTMRRVVVKAYGFGILTLEVTDITGVVIPLGTITLDGTLNARTYYSPNGIGTIECPQLSITSTNFSGAVVKVMMAGTYGDGEIN